MVGQNNFACCRKIPFSQFFPKENQTRTSNNQKTSSPHQPQRITHYISTHVRECKEAKPKLTPSPKCTSSMSSALTLKKKFKIYLQFFSCFKQQPLTHMSHHTVISLMKVCYNKCTTNYGSELDSTEEKCIDNCVDKYFDITKIVTDVAFPQPGANQ